MGMARLNLPEPEVGPNGEDEKMKIGMKRKFGRVKLKCGRAKMIGMKLKGGKTRRMMDWWRVQGLVAQPMASNTGV